MATCPNCEGFGKKIVETASGTAMFECVSCYGTGEAKPPFDTMEVCKECGGLGHRIETGTYKTGLPERRLPVERAAARGWSDAVLSILASCCLLRCVLTSSGYRLTIVQPAPHRVNGGD